MGVQTVQGVNKNPKLNISTKPVKQKAKKVPSLWSRLFFCWMVPIFINGNRRDLEEDDLVPPKRRYDSEIVGDKLEKNWLEEVRAAKMDGRDANFTKVIFLSFLWSYLPGGLMQFTSVMLRTASPLLFGKLLEYWSVNASISRQTAMYYGLAMVANNWFAAYMNHHGQLFCQQFGMKLRVATSSLMFRKIMRLSNSSLGETTAGQVVNLLSNDLLRLDLALMFLHYVWIIPIQLVVTLYLAYMQAGPASFVGIVIVIAIALPVQMGLSILMSKIRLKTAEKTDDRIKLMSEIINGIQVIKMYAWEIPFQNLVGEKREEEVVQTRKATIVRTVSIGFMLFLERTAFFITVLAYILLGNPMSANIIYPLQQFLSVIQVNVSWILLQVLSHTAELAVSLKRVQNFLTLEDRPDFWHTIHGSTNLLDSISTTSILKDEDSVKPISYTSKNNDFENDDRILQRKSQKYEQIIAGNDLALSLYDVSASWVGDADQMALRNITLRLKKGSLCAIIGAVGSGKSSILQLLLKELSHMSGTVSINGKVSYACQEAWLFPSTVRENILFGLPYDPNKYKKVCKVCTLQKDFTQFPFGDQTLVGERGVSLSGGQRARLNLARAVYRDADIYLLDDPLSAVDANVGRLLFEDCISGYLRHKTRILVTHQIHFLKAADYIVVLNEGRIENMGTFNELVSSGKDFAKLLSSFQEDKSKNALSLASSPQSDDLLQKPTTPLRENEPKEFEAQKMEEEERQSGNLRWEVISTYFRSGGSLCFIFFTLSIIVVTVACGAAVDFWVSFWANQMSKYERSLDGADVDTSLEAQVGLLTTRQYLMIHCGLVVSAITLTHLRVIPFTRLCVTASNKLHGLMFSTMLRGVMRFFDTSSSGRILNRFAKDMGSLDEILPRALLDVIQIYGVLCSILVLNAIVLYWTIIPSSILLLFFFFMVRLYLKTAQGIKRLEGTTKSPVFAMVSSSLNGISTIRANDAQQRLIHEFDKHQDLHSAAWNGYLTGGSSFGLYLDTLCLSYLACVIMGYLYIDFGSSVEVGSVALAVSQSNTLTAQLQHGARMLVEFLAQLTSVERILEYTRIDTEPNLFEGEVPIAPTWPDQGRIVFTDMSLRYAPDQEPVLKNLNIVVEKGWKVGIVGRTGAGKSSLISALFRFAIIDGTIAIDGLDTGLLSRQKLRSKISIIPQEPILFSATVRYNLDPFSIYSDDDLWRALEQVDLKSSIQSLDFKVTEGGANFSVGQRQLMCLARAVLRSNQILIMDEATANVDPQTDNFIQKTIRQQFKSCTVLTIAHRLNTIMDSDRVLVMSTGQVAEYDHPYILLSDPNSHLSAMVRETGEKNASMLLETAKEAYLRTK